MTEVTNKRRIFAPAKINLTLHVMGRHRDGYHKLDSLVAFADIGDTITISPASEFLFSIDGAFANAFGESERDCSESSKNLVVRAARSLAQITNKSLSTQITLTKNIPLASGLGGGSADAAAAILGLMDLWNLPRNAPYLPALLKNLGSDVPVCMECTPTIMRGIGDNLSPAPMLPESPIVLVNPLKPCPTKAVFLENKTFYNELTETPDNLHDAFALADFLKQHTNSLESAAINIVPEIKNILTAISLQNGNLLSRMSGSGASCFGLFDTEKSSLIAAEQIQADNPDWWVKAGWINRIARY